jgi:hypothetical protein
MFDYGCLMRWNLRAAKWIYPKPRLGTSRPNDGFRHIGFRFVAQAMPSLQVPMLMITNLGIGSIEIKSDVV